MLPLADTVIRFKAKSGVDMTPEYRIAVKRIIAKCADLDGYCRNMESLALNLIMKTGNVDAMQNYLRLSDALNVSYAPIGICVSSISSAENEDSIRFPAPIKQYKHSNKIGVRNVYAVIVCDHEQIVKGGAAFLGLVRAYYKMYMSAEIALFVVYETKPGDSQRDQIALLAQNSSKRTSIALENQNFPPVTKIIFCTPDIKQSLKFDDSDPCSKYNATFAAYAVSNLLRRWSSAKSAQ